MSAFSGKTKNAHLKRPTVVVASTTSMYQPVVADRCASVAEPRFLRRVHSGTSSTASVSIVSVRLSLSGAGEGIAPETRFATVEHYVDAFHESEIVHDGWALWFRSPVRIDIRHELESGLYIAEMPSIGLHACNTSIETVKGDIVDQIVLAWEEYALEDDEVLTEDARAIKYTMRNLVETATRVDETS